MAFDQGGIQCCIHQYATHLIEFGVGLQGIQKLLGHASLLTMVKRTHLIQHSQTDVCTRINDIMGNLRLPEVLLNETLPAHCTV